MHNGHGSKKSTKKETRSTSSSVQGGWGMFDSIAKLSQTTDKKEQKKLEDQVNNASKQFGGGEKEVQQAITNAKTIASGGQTQGQKEVFTPTTTKIPPVVDKKEEEVIVPKKVETKVTDDDKKKKYRWLNKKTGEIELKDIPFLMKMTGATGYQITPTGDIVLIDKLGGTLGFMKAADAASGILDELVGFKPDKAFGDMGDTGKAALFNKISKMDSDEFRAFLNRKGNLDRIQQYYGEMDFEAQGNFEDILKSGDAQGFAKLIRDSAGDSEGFNKALLKQQNPQQYWNENPPRTQGD